MASTGGSVFPHRTRSNSKLLSLRVDADDNIVEVESREDEEQNVKLQEIIELLLAAGYFRARIKGLSSFDKVVGGMTWCIETCNFDVDVDLLFQENLTIGQKIALTEKIVGVLPKMNCPHRLEPHQIQGLDFIHIFPVIQWLVKRAIETREEMGDYIRSYSISQFNKTHCMPEDEAFLNRKPKAVSAMCHVLDVYKPKRQYRRHIKDKLTNEELAVKSTLLEYGRNVGYFKAGGEQQKNEDDKKSIAPEMDADDARVTEEQVKNLMSGMSAMEDQEHRLTASAVGTIVGLQSAEIQQIALEYKDKQAELSLGDHSEKVGEIQHHNRVVASLRKQIDTRKDLLEKNQQSYEMQQARYEEAKDKRKKLQDYNENAEAEMKSFEEMENDENKGILQKLRTLVAMNECLKKQEQEFKAHCKEEMSRLHSNIEELKSSSMENDSEDQEQTQMIEKQYQADKEKFYKIRLLLARKNREIAIIQRKIDEVPSRAELSQYQRRFVELYNQVAAKHKETKQFYTLYNTLDDTKLYLSKEVNLLNSILDNFTEAMSSTTTREQFLKQFEQIVDGIKVNKSKLEKKKQEEKMRRDCLSDKYLDFVEKQRLYFKTVKDLKEECRKNEILLAKLKVQG